MAAPEEHAAASEEELADQVDGRIGAQLDF
jgi:hypothetical protein